MIDNWISVHKFTRNSVARCGPSEFIINHYSDFGTHELPVFNSALQCLRKVKNDMVTAICCNSEYVFGLFWERLFTIVQVRHLKTLCVAFCLDVGHKYTIKQIMADERHLVALPSVCPSEQPMGHPKKWYMTVFELSGSKESGDFLAERHFLLA